MSIKSKFGCWSLINALILLVIFAAPICMWSICSWAQAAQDSNHDGDIIPSDPIWSQLRVWVNAKSDGVSQPIELLTMAQARFTQINLNYTATDQYLNGNLNTGTATFVLRNGQNREMFARE